MTMQIISANYINAEQTSINVVLENMPPDTTITVPADPANMDYVALQEWVDGGGEIRAYEAPPSEARPK